MSLDAWITGEGLCSYCGQLGCHCPREEELYDDDTMRCDRCGGTGLSIEGWDCWYCDGNGWLEL